MKALITQDMVPSIATIGLALLAIEAERNGELDRGDFFAHVREEAEVSRQRTPDLLTPANSLHRAVDALGHALNAAGPDAASRCAVKQCCAEIAALAVRIATEGTPVFPATMPGARAAGSARANANEVGR